MIKLVLSIRSLDIGGAERQFIELVKHIDKSQFDVTVCTMYGGLQEESIKNIPNIGYVNLEKTGRYDFYQFYKNYSKLLKEIHPDVIYSFLGEMSLFSLWCKPKSSKIIWGFRASDKDWSQYGKVSRIIFWLQEKLSSKIDKIISNSYASIAYHKEYGFAMQNSMVIHNGIDSDRFKRDTQKREMFRKKYNLKNNVIVVGIVARIDYIKGYVVLAKAAQRVLDNDDEVYFFSVGGGDIHIQNECEVILGDYNKRKFFWLGKQNSLEDLYSGFDIVVSASFGEGFSNSIAEAMSCELPCVVTDVGDSAIIVDQIGIVVKPNDVDDLYEGLTTMIEADYKILGKKSRERIVQNFSIQKMVTNTEKEIKKCVE